MNNIDLKVSYTKGELRQMLGMEETKFKKWLREVEPELIKIEPRYGLYSKLLTYRAFKFLVGEYGLDDAEINKRIQGCHKIKGIIRNESP